MPISTSTPATTTTRGVPDDDDDDDDDDYLAIFVASIDRVSTRVRRSRASRAAAAAATPDASRTVAPVCRPTDVTPRGRMGKQLSMQ